MAPVWLGMFVFNSASKLVVLPNSRGNCPPMTQILRASPSRRTGQVWFIGSTDSQMGVPFLGGSWGGFKNRKDTANSFCGFPYETNSQALDGGDPAQFERPFTGSRSRSGSGDASLAPARISREAGDR